MEGVASCVSLATVDLRDVHPQLRDAAKRAPRLPYHKLERMPLMRRAAAAASTSFLVEGVTARELQSAGLRIYEPKEPASRTHGGALLWIHGGGLLLGSPAQDDTTCSMYAARLGVAVLSVHYRFAPEHPFPAAFDDVHAAWQWVQRHGSTLDVDPARVVLGGGSAGGGLAANLALRLRDDGAVMPRGLLLSEPMLDDRTAAREDIDGTAHLVWNNRSNRAAWGAYLGVEPGAHDVPPYAVAARAERYEGLPPTWIGVGSCDLFREESRNFSRALRNAGVEVIFDEVQGAFHTFAAADREAELSRTWRERQLEFMRKRLDDE